MTRAKLTIFHLAIPCRDLDEAEQFYVGSLGATLARRYDDRITLAFFGDQLVCHLAPDKIEEAPEIYPRHFGVTFQQRPEFERLLTQLTDQGVPLLKEPFTRFEGLPEEHTTFFLQDPSNNIIEFKHYVDERMMY
ncbi:MAG: VOC family protein [Gammaproteobacteria bacterium]|nr:VOC family protein [Gammaproteobacteria bacterium]